VVVQRDVYDEGCVSWHDYIHVCIMLDTVHWLVWRGLCKFAWLHTRVYYVGHCPLTCMTRVV
jgi:hypothetical protein